MSGLFNQPFPKVFPAVPSWVFNGNKESIPHRVSGITKKDFMHEGSIPKVNGKDIPISEIDTLFKPEIANKDVPATETKSDVVLEGNRNNTLFKFACKLRARNVPFDRAMESLEKMNQFRCNPPLQRPELERILNSAFRYEPAKVSVQNCTDLGNAKRLVLRYGDKIRYCYAWKKWLVWDGKTWHIDNNGQILRLAKDTVKHIYYEATQISDESQRKAIAKWGIKSEAEKYIKAMVSLVQSEPGIAISPTQLDSEPYFLSCLNGTVDLKTGVLKPHDPKDFITKTLPFEYNPKADCPLWIEFLETIFNWNYDLILFVQRAVGYSLTGDISEQCLFLLFGTGANGKSVFLKTMANLLCEFSQTADFETFLVKKNDGGVRNDLARMRGNRFISAIEAESGKRLSENLIKSLTGGDTISARFLFAEFFYFQPTFKLWLAANHKPNIRGTDHAIWRRIRLIPFNVTIPENRQDKKLEEKLRGELPGILAWAVQGCLEWQKNGLQTPEEVRTATNGYREEMDSIGAFISDCCVLLPDAKVQAGKLYEAYKKWAEENGEFILKQRDFGMRLSERGLERIESSGHWRKGIGLLENSTH